MQGMKTQLIQLSALLRLLDSGFCSYLGMYKTSKLVFLYSDSLASQLLLFDSIRQQLPKHILNRQWTIHNIVGMIVFVISFPAFMDPKIFFWCD